MRCRKDAAFKGMTTGAVAGILSAFAVGYTVTKMCSSRNSMLKKKAKRALKTVKSYVDDIM